MLFLAFPALPRPSRPAVAPAPSRVPLGIAWSTTPCPSLPPRLHVSFACEESVSSLPPTPTLPCAPSSRCSFSLSLTSPDMYVPTSSRQCSIRQRETEPAARSFSNAPLPSATAQPPGFPLRLGLLASFFRAGFRLLRFPTLWDPGARADGAGSVRSSCPCPSCHCPLDIGDSFVKISGSVPGVNISSSTEHLPVST